MTLQMNETALLMNGFTFKAEYIKFHKWYMSDGPRWDVYTARCFQSKEDSEHCIVKTAHNRRHGYTHEFFSKSEANAYIKKLIGDGYHYNKKGV